MILLINDGDIDMIISRIYSNPLINAFLKEDHEEETHPINVIDLHFMDCIKKSNAINDDDLVGSVVGLEIKQFLAAMTSRTVIKWHSIVLPEKNVIGLKLEVESE